MKFFSKSRNLKLLEEINKKSLLRRYINFILGCLIVSLSYNIFLSPNALVPGGVGGLAIILNNYIPISNGLFIFICNFFLLILSYIFLGKEKTKGSLLGAILFPLFVSLTSHINVWLNIENDQLLLSSVFGGVMYGFGAGMIFKAGFTTAGTDILNQIISKYFKIGMGKSMLICDGSIILLSSLAFGPIKLMYSIIIIYIISLISDRVILGVSDSKAFYIVTEKDDAIREFIIKYLNHGVTVFPARGGFAKDKQTVLMCVLPTKDYFRLKEGINQIDKDAFFVVTDAYEVFGGE